MSVAMVALGLLYTLSQFAHGLSETGKLTLFNSILVAATGLGVAVIAKMRTRDKQEAQERHDVAAADRAALVEQTAQVAELVRPKNGHDSLGDGVAAIEERLIAGEQRFDAIDVKLDERGARLEAIEATAAENKVDLSLIKTSLDSLTAKVSEVLEQEGAVRSDLRLVSNSLVKHLDEWDPLLDWAQRASGMKKKPKGGK